jgi:hypothetical protein
MEENVKTVEIENVETLFNFVKDYEENEDDIKNKFGFEEWKQIDYYKNRVPIGLIEQWPCLYYLLEDYWKEAIKKTPLEEMEDRKK